MDSIAFIKQFPQVNFAKGEFLMGEGYTSSSLLAIQQGFVKVTSVDDDGNKRLLWIAGRYDIVPTERLFSSNQPLAFFYTALTDGSAYRIEKTAFLAFAKTNLALMTEIAVSMSEHYDDLLSRINSVEQATVRDKLLATLQYLAGRFSADTVVDLYQLGLHITQQDLADMIGATRETTTVELQKLRKSGHIDYGPRHFIVFQ